MVNVFIINFPRSGVN